MDRVGQCMYSAAASHGTASQVQRQACPGFRGIANIASRDGKMTTRDITAVGRRYSRNAHRIKEMNNHSYVTMFDIALNDLSFRNCWLQAAFFASRILWTSGESVIFTHHLKRGESNTEHSIPGPGDSRRTPRQPTPTARL